MLRVIAVSAALLAAMPSAAEAQEPLCKRLGGADAISTVVKSFLTKMRKDDPDKLGRFWLYRGDDGVLREEQLIVDFVQSATGCDRLYVGRTMADAHKGMKLSSCRGRTGSGPSRFSARRSTSSRCPPRCRRRS